MSFHRHYNNLFLRNLAEAAKETRTATDKYGVRIVRAAGVTDGEPYWRVIGVHHLLPDENQGNHHVFLDALDEKGDRLRQPILEVEWGWEGMHEGEKPTPARLDKSDHDPAADIAIDRVGQRVWLQVKGAKSDRVENLHTDHGWEKRTNSEENGSYEGHHSFYVVFQRTSGAGPGTSPGTGDVSEPIIEPLPERSALEAALWEAGDPHLIPLNREAALYRFAQQHNLGERLTDEYSVEHQGQQFVSQIFEQGLVYVPFGRWDQATLATKVDEAVSFSLGDLSPAIPWQTEMTGFFGTRWEYWDLYLKNTVPGLEYRYFIDEVEVRNPHLVTDGHVFRPEKTYQIPGNLGHVVHPKQKTKEETGRPPARFAQGVDGKFQIDSRPLRFIGVNIRGLVHYGHDPETFKNEPPHHRQVQLQAAKDMNARLVRVFLPHKNATPQQIEARLRETLTLIKQQFSEIYLLPALTNLYNDVPFYVQGDGKYYEKPAGGDREILNHQFYAAGYKENYLPFVEHIVKAFKDEPRIFAWEIGNELKAQANPQLLVDFMTTVAEKIKGWDPNHMVTTGMISTRHAFMPKDSKLRTDLYGSKFIDFITIHAYNGNEHPPEVEDDSDLARRFSKPFIIEEAGFLRKQADGSGYDDRPLKTRDDLANWFRQGASCYMPWGFVKTANDNGDGDADVGMSGPLHGDFDQLYKLLQNCGHLLLTTDINQPVDQAIASINYHPELAFSVAPSLPWPLVTDGFDFPVGRPHGQGYYVAASFLDPTYYADEGFWHTGEDWNGLGGGDTDLGAPVYAVANGRVVTAHFFPFWGNVILIEHVLPSGKKVWSQYAHLQERFAGKDEIVQRGQQIGTIGKGEGNRYLAHLHFEIRLKRMPASQWGWSKPEERQAVLQAYAHPTNFINGHRPNF